MGGFKEGGRSMRKGGKRAEVRSKQAHGSEKRVLPLSLTGVKGKRHSKARTSQGKP